MGQSSKNGADFTLVAGKQFIILLAGLLVMAIAARVPYRRLKTFSPYLFAFSLGLTALVFLPELGFSWGGARRWLNIGPYSFQPSELLKFAFILYIAAWASVRQAKINTLKAGLLPFLAFCGIVTVIMIAQPDNGTLGIMLAAAIAIFAVAGANWRHLAIICLIGLATLGFLVYTKPYVKERLLTFMDNNRDAQGSGYQIKQSLIAIGSGGIFGRGFGQSLQKFNLLPEPIGDSIFAVAGEEFGLVGTFSLLTLYLLLGLWGLKIIGRVNDPFGRLLGTGLLTLIIIQSFVNIGSMVGAIPMTGVPLVFVSHGGTALLIALLEMGILLNISKHKAN